ncbi:MAG: Cu(I)-responsive transcriptional regulator [Rhodospirillaceae bacterium]|nr:Cu(I)-responsive transcriptional regulator [Rhodospirillaceae bacterium]
MNIGNASKISGVPAKTIRYYEQVGLIPPAGRAANGYRDYDIKDVEVLRFIKRSRNLGFSVEEVSNLLDLWRNGKRTSADVKAIATSHISQIEDKIIELQSILDTLKNLTSCCHGDDRPDCPILDDLAGIGEGMDEKQKPKVRSRAQ